ncbi:putative O-glycosylation ligase, exosortase A system-associated [Massilia atriviolacea]|uniref:Putative O-glycosylation ligase, exosortase A system-associated n=1 Tax=Massilia atriviolacea TaxID=2495579 RepID=A0A430HP91_9BURK|nr:putative O-glycosylation ligase, exosortase A system-associated [Massilia atriviolacea]RSZ59328.1 putative O-glycosylation ligase, exosortase A system-associated [Massilia atriviolacea]
MRDLVITLAVFGSLPFILKRPYIGVLMWVWISVMNPHRLSWGFAYSFPFAAIIAGVTLIGLLVTREPKKLPMTPIVCTLMLFSAWMGITTIFSMWPDESVVMLNRVSKIMLMTFATIMLIKTQKQIQLLIWTLVGSLGYYGVKGGIFTVATGGSSIVWGPQGSYIEGNNEVALAFITIIPIMFYLYMSAEKKWIRWGMAASIMLCSFAALGSYSRGALVGIAAMLFFLWLKSPKKVLLGGLMVLMVPFAIAFMPDKWSSRMETINTYKEDSSAMGRINAWYMAYNMAKDRPLGGGFEIYNRTAFELYAPVPDDVHAAHSIYFQALGEHGFVGLGIYLLLAFLTWRKAAWIVRISATREDFKWAGNLARMIQVSLLGFGVGGAFLSLLYYDVPYYLMAAVVSMGYIIDKTLEAEAAAARVAAREAARAAQIEAHAQSQAHSPAAP